MINGEYKTSLVTEFGTKGSLKDLLEDKDTSKFNLTWEMKRCLMLDVIQGLHAVHKQEMNKRYRFYFPKMGH